MMKLNNVFIMPLLNGAGIKPQDPKLNRCDSTVR